MATGNIFNNDYIFHWSIYDVQYTPKELIQSPTFTIQPFSGVFWCLRVEIVCPIELKGINCYLYRIPDEFGPGVIFVAYQISVAGPVIKHPSKVFTRTRFVNADQPSSKLYVELSKGLLKQSQELIVTCKFFKCNFEQSLNSGFYYSNLSCLSKDLLSGYFNQVFFDITLNVQQNVFYAHKAILYARLPNLAAKLFFMNYETQSEIEVYSIKPNLIKSLLHYAYSGCLTEDCFSNVRELYELAGELQLPDLQQILRATSNSCVARTIIDIQKIVLSWIFDYSLNWTVGVKDIAILYHNTGHAEIVTIGYEIFKISKVEFLRANFQFPKMVNGCTILMDCTVTATRDVKNKIRTVLDQKIRHVFISNEVWSSEPLCCKHDFVDNTSTVKFLFEIKLCDGECKSFIEESNTDIVCSSPFNRDIEKLSFDLSNLLEPSVDYDILLMTGKQLRIPAHRAILAARSVTFHSLIRQYTTPTNVLKVDGVSNDALIFVVYYIYSGKTKNLTLSNVHDFNEAAKYFDMHALVLETNSFMNHPHTSSPDLSY